MSLLQPKHRSRARWFWHRQMKKPFFGRFMKTWRWPQGIARDGWQEVQIPSRSHSLLSAIVKTSDRAQPARGVIVCAHPMGLASKGFWLRHGHADALVAAGFHVVAFDFNGFGESPSTNFDYPGDSLSVGQWARTRFPGLPVHALCASFGAMNTLNACDDPEFPYTRVVAEGCAPSLPQFWRVYPFAHFVLTVARWVAPAAERRLRPALHVPAKKPHVEILLIHSRADRLTPVAFGDELESFAATAGGVHRLVLERAEHTHGLRDEPQVYLPAVLAFFSENPLGHTPS